MSTLLRPVDYSPSELIRPWIPPVYSFPGGLPFRRERHLSEGDLALSLERCFIATWSGYKPVSPGPRDAVSRSGVEQGYQSSSCLETSSDSPVSAWGSHFHSCGSGFCLPVKERDSNKLQQAEACLPAFLKSSSQAPR